MICWRSKYVKCETEMHVFRHLGTCLLAGKEISRKLFLGVPPPHIYINGCEFSLVEQKAGKPVLAVEQLQAQRIKMEAQPFLTCCFSPEDNPWCTLCLPNKIQVCMLEILLQPKMHILPWILTNFA